jgi:hypothetical protein
MSMPTEQQISYPEQPAAAGFRELRGKLPELWARMPKMSSVLDVNTMTKRGGAARERDRIPPDSDRRGSGA